MKRKVVVFFWFAANCPHYNNETDVNNGYGCNHPEQEETDPDENGKEQGKCYCWSCPLGVEPDEEDWNNPDVDFDGFEYENFLGGDGKWLMDGENISVSVMPNATEDEQQALYNYEQYISRYDPAWDGGTWKHLHKK
jgi:hypothetical protein